MSNFGTIDRSRIEYLNAQAPTFLGLSGKFNNQQTYICPCCQSGSGSKKTGLSKVPGKNIYHCFACGESGDLLSFAKVFYGQNFAQVVETLENYYNAHPSVEIEEEEYVEVNYEDQTEYFKKIKENLDPTYLESRGISEKTQRHYWVGTDLKWINPLVKDGHKYPTPRCIIPTSKYSYLARDIRKNLNEKQHKYEKIKYGQTQIFNTRLRGSKCDLVYIVEGEIDSMSIHEATGGFMQAIGLGSTSMWRYLYNEITFEGNNLKGKTFVLMLDNDKGGNVCRNNIKTLFNMYNIPYLVQEYPLEYNDPNEYLQKDREGFTNMLRETYGLYIKKQAESEIEIE